jgi:hypothetical protein
MLKGSRCALGARQSLKSCPTSKVVKCGTGDGRVTSLGLDFGFRPNQSMAKGIFPGGAENHPVRRVPMVPSPQKGGAFLMFFDIF